VDEAFRERFIDESHENTRFFVPGPAGKPHFDLPGYVLHRLKSAGIRHVEALALDTYSEAERFYSYRRSTHLGEPSYGRQISMIGLRETAPPKS
jgi:copper oxidase (laccase) domain-containing protein